ELFGSTQPLPDRVARISAPVEGRVLSVLRDENGKPVAEGQLVTAGTVVVQLDPRMPQANRDRLEAAQEELKEATKHAEYAVKLADIEVKPLEDLTRTGATSGPLPLVSRVELEKVRVALDDARSKQKAAELKQLSGLKELA